MNKPQIEQAARDLQIAIWKSLGRRGEQANPYLVADPLIGIEESGFRYIEQEYLGRFSTGSGTFEMAGYFDRETRAVVVANRFSDQVKLFTAAHELGHVMLHPDQTRHRDIPIRGMELDSVRQSKVEREANYFAGCYLIPRKLLANEFQARFGPSPFVFDDASAWHLMPEDPDLLLRSDMRLYERAVTLGTARSFNGRHFQSLVDVFGVSVTTMAIRIEDLGLIRYP